MAGSSGLTPEHKKAALRASMRPGDYLIQDGEGEWTIMRPAERDLDQSILNTVGEFADKYLGFGGDRRRARLISGVASQWYGLDEAGNPAFGETPGIVHETKALGILPTTLARAAMDAYTNKVGKAFGISTEDPMYQMVQKAMLSDPEFAVEAMEKADRLRQAVREDMRLPASRGFEENAQESLGVMLGQLPVPGKLIAKGAEVSAAAPSVLNRVAQGAEWFTPTVRPTVGNYATGTGVGATLSTLAGGGEDEEVPTILPDPEQKGLYHVRPMYSDGSVGYSGHPDDEEALKRLLAEEAEREPQEHAKGGKVRALSEWLESMHRKRVPDAERLAKLTKFDPKLSSGDIDILQQQSRFGSPALSDEEYGTFVDIISDHAVPLPRMNLYRGVQVDPDGLDMHLKSSYSDLAYASPARTHASGYAIDPAPRIPEEFLDVSGTAPHLLRLSTEPGTSRGFVSPFYDIHGQAEVVLPPGTSFTRTGEPTRAKLRSDRFRGLFDPEEIDAQMKRALREQFTTDGFRVPVKINWEPEFEEGGQVKDYCSGGMAAVKSMKAKYAEGGKVNSALKAIKDAIAHLDNNDTASAMRTLNANPDALRDPGIAEALRKLRHPTTAKQGRRALDSAAAADTERAKVSTFAKGGKVNNARRTAAAVLRYMRSIDSNMSYDAYDDLDKLAKKAKKSPAQLDSILQETYGNLTRDASKSEIRSEVKKVVERGVGPNPSFGRGAGRMKPQGSTKKD